MGVCFTLKHPWMYRCFKKWKKTTLFPSVINYNLFLGNNCLKYFPRFCLVPKGLVWCRHDVISCELCKVWIQSLEFIVQAQSQGQRAATYRWLQIFGLLMVVQRLQEERAASVTQWQCWATCLWAHFGLPRQLGDFVPAHRRRGRAGLQVVKIPRAVPFWGAICHWPKQHKLWTSSSSSDGKVAVPKENPKPHWWVHFLRKECGVISPVKSGI